jgi:hypothetical protein
MNCQSAVTVQGAVFDVRYWYEAGLPGLVYRPNGDPGYPEEPAEVEIYSVQIQGIEVIDLISKETLEAIKTKLLDLECHS